MITLRTVTETSLRDEESTYESVSRTLYSKNFLLYNKWQRFNINLGIFVTRRMQIIDWTKVITDLTWDYFIIIFYFTKHKFQKKVRTERKRHGEVEREL